MTPVLYCSNIPENEFVPIWVVDGVGKTSLILALVSEEFPEEVSIYSYLTYNLL